MDTECCKGDAARIGSINSSFFYWIALLPTECPGSKRSGLLLAKCTSRKNDSKNLGNGPRRGLLWKQGATKTEQGGSDTRFFNPAKCSGDTSRDFIYAQNLKTDSVHCRR